MEDRINERLKKSIFYIKILQLFTKYLNKIFCTYFLIFSLFFPFHTLKSFTSMSASKAKRLTKSRSPARRFSQLQSNFELYLITYQSSCINMCAVVHGNWLRFYIFLCKLYYGKWVCFCMHMKFWICAFEHVCSQ